MMSECTPDIIHGMMMVMERVALSFVEKILASGEGWESVTL